eukprot:TRINITY_DN284_c0_g1_i6.p1 TRINITY_DN284_c0_g1~~TRINITY_DN284_c0_g1_i6.p1  ORF type:complete len:449 (-),score=71.49 TRINITY_DN284_c0_g1_i6:450-1796(-)
MSSVEDVDEDAPQLDSTGIDVRCPGAPLPDNEEERLEVLRALSVLDTEAEVQFDKVTSLGARLFDTPICLVSLVDQKRQWFKSKFGLDADETPRRLAFCAYTILSKSPEVFVVPNAAEDPRFKYNALVTGPPDIRFYAGAPLIYGKVRLGSLCVIDRKPRTFSVQQKSLLADLAALVVRQISDRSELKKIHNYYISSTAHNLRTPLASLQLCLNLLEDTSIRLPAIQSAAIVNMKSLVDVMNWTINRSLSSAKNHVPVMLGVAQLGSFSIARVIKRVKKSLKARQSVKSNVQVSVDSDFGDLIYSDERSVFFALSELAVNAVDYGRGGACLLSCPDVTSFLEWRVELIGCVQTYHPQVWSIFTFTMIPKELVSPALMSVIMVSSHICLLLASPPPSSSSYPSSSSRILICVLLLFPKSHYRQVRAYKNSSVHFSSNLRKSLDLRVGGV